MSQGISPISVGAALKSLRNNDFDAYSAIYEIIDNSIQASAKEIKLKFDMRIPPHKHKPRPFSLAFGDDGHGMDPDTLQRCLAIGFSNRYDDRKGIGRFGVGMTLGAISICDKIEVYSREKHGNWYYTFLDNSGIDNDVEPFLHFVEQKNLPAEYKDMVGDYGTLVIWSKIERIDSEFNLDELKHRVGRIYRKFIGHEIISDGEIKENDNIRKIFIDDGSNNTIVTAHDPLYVTKNQKFPDDELATLQPEHIFEYTVHDVDAPSTGEKKGKITIRTSLLPKSWRLPQKNADLVGYSGNSKHNNERRVFENEGFSILRNGREVYYGHISKFSPRAEPLDRFWGCEIDFDPVLDHWFSVRNIKIGARPLKELRDELTKKLKPTVLNNFRRIISECWNVEEQKKYEAEQGPLNSHINIEKDLEQIITPLQTNIEPNKIISNVESHSKELFDDEQEQQDYVEIMMDPASKYKIIHDYKARSDGPFIDVLDDVGKKTVHYNMRHPFFVEIYRKIDEMKAMSDNEQNMDLKKLSYGLKDDLDRLIYAYAEGQYDLDDLTRIQSVQDTVEEHLIKWSHHLKKTYKIG